MVRGEVLRMRSPRGARGHEQRGALYAVVVQADEILNIGTVLVAPTSPSAHPRSFRPIIEIDGTETSVLVEQTKAVDARTLGASAGRLSASEVADVDAALAIVLGL